MKKVRVNSTSAVGALASLALTKQSFLAVSDSEYRILSAKIVAIWMNIADPDDGGLMFGLAHSDYTAAEIEEWLEATTSIDRGDMIANERANRKCRMIGTFGQQNFSSVEGDQTFNDGKEVTVKLNWAIPIGQQVNVWMYNSSNDVWSTGSSVGLIGSVNVAYQ